MTLRIYLSKTSTGDLYPQKQRFYCCVKKSNWRGGLCKGSLGSSKDENLVSKRGPQSLTQQSCGIKERVWWGKKSLWLQTKKETKEGSGNSDWLYSSSSDQWSKAESCDNLDSSFLLNQTTYVLIYLPLPDETQHLWNPKNQEVPLRKFSRGPIPRIGPSEVWWAVSSEGEGLGSSLGK